MPVTSLPHLALSAEQPMCPLHIFQASQWGNTTELPLKTAMRHRCIEAPLGCFEAQL